MPIIPKLSESEQSEVTVPALSAEGMNFTLESAIYRNMTTLRSELMRQIAEAIEVFERDLQRNRFSIGRLVIQSSSRAILELYLQNIW